MVKNIEGKGFYGERKWGKMKREKKKVSDYMTVGKEKKKPLKPKIFFIYIST